MCDRPRRNPGLESRRGREHAFRRLQPASAYYRPDRVGAARFAIKCVPIRNWQVWCDDPRREDYNKLLDRRSGCEFSHERLARADKLYDLFVVVGYNWPNPVPNRGSRYSSTLGGARAIRLQDALLSMRQILIGSSVA